VAFLVSCVIISPASGVPGRIAGALIISGVVVRVAGEPWHSAAGECPGAFGAGAGLAEAVGPGSVIALRVSRGRVGWIVLGVMFVVTGMPAPWIAGGRKEGGKRCREFLGARRGASSGRGVGG